MSETKQTILVTGGAGYIGSHATLALIRAGYEVVILDNLSCGHLDIVEEVLKIKLIVGDIADRPLLDSIFNTYNIAAVMHFAAFLEVGESVKDPAKYYRNNVCGTLTLLEAMLAAGVKQFVFSSTCAIYGMPREIPMDELHPHDPLSAYASSKEMVEKILADFDRAYQFKSVSFRYFNASGADESGNLGEDRDRETHLIPLILLTALQKRECIYIFGTDYPTPDGTAIRDYIHVSDLADAHVKGLEYLLNGGETNIFNLGNGNGFSVKEVIETAIDVTGVKIIAKESDRRPGDAPILVGSSHKARQILNWNPQYSDLSKIIADAWKWHKKRHG
ncbi:MAG: UDP-glucose 4-epimerase GalE [Prochloraceae cyanobacterium]